MDWFTVISTILEHTMEPIRNQSGYMFSYESNVKNLEQLVNKLIGKKKTVDHLVEAAINNGEEVEKEVEHWLKHVKDTAEKADVLLYEYSQKKKCCIGMCPDVKSRYRLSKKAVEEAEAIKGLLREEGGFRAISYAPPKEIHFIPSKKYKKLESRVSTMNRILNLLTDDNVEIVGVYGPSGVGKTTLAKEVAAQVQEEKRFDAVAVAYKIGTREVRAIQREIGDSLNHKFEEENESVRATRLRLRVKKVKKVLVILDDIRAVIDLEEVGIPFGDEHKGCKILLTSRDSNVLAHMDARTIELGVLQEKEAWDLFKQMAGDDVENPKLRSIAIEVCKKCGGLPITIVKVAKSLRNKDTVEWRRGLLELKGPSSAAELSYRHLVSEQLKKAFLLCSLIHHGASIFDMLKQGMSMGLFPGTKTLEEAREKLQSLVHKLKSVGLLLDSNDAGEFSMHDIDRQVAASIASREHHMVSVGNEEGLREWPNYQKLRKCQGISLLHDSSMTLPEQPDCPQLKYFHIKNRDPSLNVPDEFFKKMSALKVLDMNGVQFSSLPSSLHCLEILRTLCLEACTLKDVTLSPIGELKQLEILSFLNSIIEKFPEEVGQLNQLRLLNLNNCYELEVIPQNVISRLAKLEELYIGNSFSQWEAEGDGNQGGGKASLSELKQLPNLTTLEMQVPDSKIIPRDLSFENLKRYKIFIGDVWDCSGTHETSRTLKLKLDWNYDLNHGSKVLLEKAEDLYLDELKGVKNVLYELDTEGFPQLKHLHAQNGKEVKYIVKSTGHFPVAFSVLESLSLQNLINLEEIHHGQVGTESFRKLRIIKVRSCTKLRSLFSYSIARGLSQLQVIEVIDCKKMEEVVAKGSENGDEETDEIEFGQLHSLILQGLPKFISFYTEVKRPSVSDQQGKVQRTVTWSKKNIAPEDETALFNQKVKLPSLEHLKLCDINTIKIWQDQLSALPVCIQNLTSMMLEGCRRLKYLLPSSMVSGLVQLKHLEISNCDIMQEIILVDEIQSDQGMIDKIVFTNLQSLKIKGLNNLTRFCLADHVHFPSLTQLHLEHCPKLETFFPKSVRASKGKEVMTYYEQCLGGIQPLFSQKIAFPGLETITISHLRSVGILWDNQLPADNYCKLRTMEVEHCEKLKKIFPSNMLEIFCRLETLSVNSCGSLEEVFDLEGLNIEIRTVKSAIATQLRKLYLFSLPKLKHIWSRDPKGILSFPNLKSVDIFACERLKSLFPASVARSLLKLERLEIDACGLEEIITKDEAEEKGICIFEFPQVSYCRLWNLTKLKCLYPGMHSAEWPALKSLKTYHCGEIKIFSLELHGVEKTYSHLQPLLLVEKIVPNLEELSLNSNDISMMYDCQFPEGFFSKIQALQVHCFHIDSAIFPLGFLKKFHNLEKLDVGCCRFQELIPFGGVNVDDEENGRKLLSVRSLKVVALPNIKQISKPGSRADLFFPNLDSLQVWQCKSLVSLASPSATFGNLTKLDVWNCHGARSILASSTAKSLLQLEKMTIRECNQVTEIVSLSNVGEQTRDEITFYNLKCLELYSLPSLTNFCSENYAFNFPSLEDVTVVRCPKLIIFSFGDSSTPKLHKVWLTEEKDQGQWEGDLNITLYHGYDKMVSRAGGYDMVDRDATSYSIEGI